MVTFSQQATTPSAGGGVSSSKARGSSGVGKKFLPLAVVVAVVVLVIGGGYYFWKGRGISIGSGEYQAVFLTNDQVYFGKIAKSDSTEVVLRDVYYMVIRQPMQIQPQIPEATLGAQPQQTDRPRYTLYHLGDREIHGPMDEMRINRTQVLFIEPLRGDGVVVQGIQRYKEQRQAAEQQQEQAPQE